MLTLGVSGAAPRAILAVRLEVTQHQRNDPRPTAIATAKVVRKGNGKGSSEWSTTKCSSKIPAAATIAAEAANLVATMLVARAANLGVSANLDSGGEYGLCVIAPPNG